MTEASPELTDNDSDYEGPPAPPPPSPMRTRSKSKTKTNRIKIERKTPRVQFDENSLKSKNGEKSNVKKR